jgi:hypothetical protein
MSLFDEFARHQTRRQFFSRGRNVLGTAALAQLMGGMGSMLANSAGAAGGRSDLPHFAAKAKPVAILGIPPTILLQTNRYSGKFMTMLRPAKISARTTSGGMPFNKA